MAHVFTKAEMLSRGYAAGGDKVGDLPEFFFDRDNIPGWSSTSRGMKKLLKECSDNTVDVFFRCDHEVKEGCEYVYSHWTHFVNPPKMYELVTFNKFKTIYRNERKSETNKTTKERNMVLYSMYALGDTSCELRCPFTGIDVLKAVSVRGIDVSDVDYHHIAFKDNKSFNKLKEQPSKILSTQHLYLRDNAGDNSRVAMLMDLFSTVALSHAAHKAVHTSNMNCITMYADKEKPWALRNKANWDKLRSWLKQEYEIELNVEFDDHIASLTVDNVIPERLEIPTSQVE